MKAVDYVTRFKTEGGTIRAIGKVIFDMMNEVRTIGLQRKITTDDGLFSILDETDLKFKSFFRQIGGRLSDGSLVHEDAFKRMIRHKMIDIFNAWNRARGGRLLSQASLS